MPHYHRIIVSKHAESVSRVCFDIFIMMVTIDKNQIELPQDGKIKQAQISLDMSNIL